MTANSENPAHAVTLVVPARDAAGLAQAMVRLSDSHLRVRLGIASREIAVRELDHAMLMRRFIELLGIEGRIHE